MQELHALFGEYYGLDWLTLVVGLCGSYLVTGGHLRRGFSLNILACCGGFCLALMSGQHGFVVYNLMLVGLNARGVLRGGRRKTDKPSPLFNRAVTSPEFTREDAPAYVPAQ